LNDRHFVWTIAWCEWTQKESLRTPEKNLFQIHYEKVVNRYRLMTTMIKNPAQAQIPAVAGKKSRAVKKKSPAKGFFGMLSDWKIDTQALKDELRD
jgi:hypothetical protein